MAHHSLVTHSGSTHLTRSLVSGLSGDCHSAFKLMARLLTEELLLEIGIGFTISVMDHALVVIIGELYNDMYIHFFRLC
jgi:hypothetical protein